MSAKSEHSVRVRNARQQPVELHLPQRMIVLNPADVAELASDEISCPQVQVLLRHRLIQVVESAPAGSLEAFPVGAENSSAASESPPVSPSELSSVGRSDLPPAGADLPVESTSAEAHGQPVSAEPTHPEVPVASRRRSPRGTSNVEGDK